MYKIFVSASKGSLNEAFVMAICLALTHNNAAPRQTGVKPSKRKMQMVGRYVTNRFITASRENVLTPLILHCFITMV